MKKNIYFMVIYFFMIILVGCNIDNNGIKKIEIDNNSLKESYFLNEFSISEINIIIRYENGDSKKIELLEKYMDKTVEQISTQIGEHEVTVTYESFQTEMTINIVNEVFIIKYSLNDEIIHEESYIKNQEIVDLFDYETTENDTIWYYDNALTSKVMLPININGDLTLFTDNKPEEYIENGIIYREMQDNTYMVYSSIDSSNSYLLIPEEINGKKVTSISNNLNEEAKKRGPFDSVFLPKTINKIPSNFPYDKSALFYTSLYYIDEIESGLVVNTYGDKQYLGGGIYGSVAFKVDDYLINDNVVYGIINNELYLLDCLFDQKEEFIIPTVVDNYSVTGIACFSGLLKNANKIIIPSEIKNIEIFSLSGFKNKSEDECEIIFEGYFENYKDIFKYMFKGDYNYNINFVNDYSESFKDVDSEILSNKQYFIFHKNNITINFSDNKKYEYYNGVILENNN